MICLKNKKIIVTGGSSGIGRSTSLLCSKLGAEILLIGRREEKLREVILEMDNPSYHSYLVGDITNHDKFELIFKEKLKNFGKVDGVVHSAGTEMTRPIKMLKISNLDEVMQLNLFSPINITRILTGRGIFNEDGGSILFISSIVGLLGQPGKVGYSASKGALISATKSLALELAPKKIRVNSVLPAMVKTEMSINLLEKLPENARTKIEEMHPLGIGSPNDIANAAVFLLSDLSKWITGTAMIIDGGYSSS
jgi:NAD(P)-dependent dehydrogenase (short-subunit alcohol dehydrogenase family)